MGTSLFSFNCINSIFLLLYCHFPSIILHFNCRNYIFLLFYCPLSRFIFHFNCRNPIFLSLYCRSPYFKSIHATPSHYNLICFKLLQVFFNNRFSSMYKKFISTQTKRPRFPKKTWSFKIIISKIRIIQDKLH